MASLESTAEVFSASKIRRRRQAWLWWILLLVAIGGWWFPLLGLLVPGCMLFGWGIAAIHGRTWCNWMCPRGAFHDLLLIKASRKKTIPLLLRSTGFRVVVLVLLMGIMAVRLASTWADINAMGLVFVSLLTATTAVGIVLGIIYSPRAWCLICPAGTVAKWIGKGKYPRLQVNDDLCTDCKKCSRVCPMQIQPFQYRKEAMMGDADCLKCGICAEKCPEKALSFQEKAQ